MDAGSGQDVLSKGLDVLPTLIGKAAFADQSSTSQQGFSNGICQLDACMDGMVSRYHSSFFTSDAPPRQ